MIRLAPEIAALFPGGVVASAISGSGPTQQLLPEEFACVEKAVEKRQREFAAGRACARRSLAALGFAEMPLMADQDRTVRWPAGAIGSISHTEGYCAAVAARTSRFAGIGIDAEIVGRVESNLWRLVFRQEEIEWLDSHGPLQQIEIATILFSAKEAFYKCQYAVTQGWLGFEEASVRVDGDEFWVSIHNPAVEDTLMGREFGGKFAVLCSRVICGIALERR